MATPAHIVYSRSEPVPGPWSSARVRAAVSRIVRHHARATYGIRGVFGPFTVAANALRARVEALSSAEDRDVQKRSERLHQLCVWLSAVCETIEAENDDAASLRVYLAVIVVECERIAEADVTAPAVEEYEDEDVDSAA